MPSLPQINFTSQESYTHSLVGGLRAKLKDLQGTDVLAGEMIQNADDVKDATEIIFDVTKAALVVENDASFRPEDFARIKEIANGGKLNEEGTTGAFGIGFISVYQITDAPLIQSAGYAWQIHPVIGKIDVGVASDDGRTYFFLPWATDPNSEVRRELRRPAIDASSIVEEMHNSLAQALPTAMLFLQRLQFIELRREGRTSFRWERVRQDEFVSNVSGSARTTRPTLSSRFCAPQRRR